MLTLGIESTCDETACAVVRDGKEILSNVISSQIDLHAVYGGVVPELACRQHVEMLLPVIDQALKEAKVTLQEIDLIAVAQGPGLIGALLLGLNTAKALSLALGKPFIGVNHVQAHLYSAYMSYPHEILFPCLGLILSGGHTLLMQMQDLATYQVLGQTVDDAMGEAFDKAAKLLGLPYPGGPFIEALAREGSPDAYAFKSGTIKERPLDFSFSGLKTALLYAVQGKELNEQNKRDLAASFQAAAFKAVKEKTLSALKRYNCSTVLCGGGVTQNQALRVHLQQAAPECTWIWPSLELTQDNAAMIAGLGSYLFQKRGCGDSFHIESYTRGLT